MMISFILLSWNSEKYLARCFDSIIAKCQYERIIPEIIVVDNGSKDKSVSILNEYEYKYPQIFKKILLDKNCGTTYTRNLGLRIAKSEYICIMDSDTELRSGNLSDVISLLQTNRKIGIIAPKLMTIDGKVQDSVKKFPTLWQKLIKIPKLILSIEVKNFDFYAAFPFEKTTSVESAVSACWFFKKYLTKLIGFLDERIFYSPEDLDYCLRVKKAGKLILYYPYIEILHFTQQVSHKKPLSRISVSHFVGLIYYFKKHGGWVKNDKTSWCKEHD
jgi:GT2 family glycosyltransferase